MPSFPLGKEAIYLRQAGTLLPPREGNNSLQADSQAGALLPPREGNNSLQADSQAGALLPPREGSSSSQATAHLPLREGCSISQAIAHLPLGEGSNSPLATAHLPPREGSSSSQATVHLPSGEAGSSSRQLLTFLLGKEAILHWQLLTFLPGKEAVPPRLLLIFPPDKQAVLPRQLLTSPLGKVTVLPSQPPFLPGRREVVILRQAILLGQVGRASRHSTRHRAPQTFQENSTASQADSTNSQEGNSSPTIPSRLPQGSSNEEPNLKWVINLSSKPLTPAQRSVLAKGPNFAVSSRQPPNLEYITAIEAACTKLSQQDTEELRADINRVLRSSHPPNLT